MGTSMAIAYKGPWSQHTTLGQLLHWKEHHKFELIDGVPCRSQDPDAHPNNAIADGIHNQLMAASAAAGWQPVPKGAAVRLNRGDEADDLISTMVRPDVAVVCEPRRIDKLGLRGAPDWVAEVVSPATAVRDHMIKRQVYERVGTVEYWLVQPRERLLTIYHQCKSGFGKPELHELCGQTELSILPGVYIDWGLALLPFGEVCD